MQNSHRRTQKCSSRQDKVRWGTQFLGQKLLSEALVAG